MAVKYADDTLYEYEIAFENSATADGTVFGTTVVCAGLTGQPSFAGHIIKILNGPAKGQERAILVHAGGGNTITVAAPFTDNTGAVVQITIGTRFAIKGIGGGGAAPPPPPAPSVGLWMFGTCDPTMVASTTTLVLTNLAGFNDDLFNNEFWIQIIHNADAPGTAPEREIRRVTDYVGATGTFTTDAFSTNVEANDLVCVFHESIMSVEILGYGTLTLSSATVPEDNLRPEANDYFNGCLLMPTEGTCRFQPRRIVDWVIGTGVPGTGIFTLDPNNPFTAAPGLVDYVIIGDQAEFIPAVDAIINRTPSDVIGGKADTPDYTRAATQSSLVRLIKGILGSRVIAEGILDTSSATVPADSARTEGNDYFNGYLLMTIAGAVAFQPRRIVDYTGVGGIFTLDPNNPFTAPSDTVLYVVIADETEFVPAIDGTNNRTPSDVIGSKADTAIYAADTVSSIIRYLKGILNSINMGLRPIASLYEGWQDEAGIDPTVWTTTTAGTGAVARNVAEPPYLKVLLSGPANADTARLYSDQRWFCGPETYGTNTLLRRLVMEFEAKLATVASIDNGNFFMGLAATQTAYRTTDNLAGFILDGSDVLNSITDDGVGETTKAVGAPTLTNWHKYRIEVYEDTIEFYIDEALVATHDAAENLPDTAMWLVFYLPQEAAANGGELHVGIVRTWVEDIAR